MSESLFTGLGQLDYDEKTTRQDKILI